MVARPMIRAMDIVSPVRRCRKCIIVYLMQALTTARRRQNKSAPDPTLGDEYGRTVD